MLLLNEFSVFRKAGIAKIQLLEGDLSRIPPEFSTDILVVSAFPGEYIALPGSLFAALQEQGLSVAKMAQAKESDLRNELDCWLSKTLSPEEQKKFNFKRVLCFEPEKDTAQQQTVVGNIFRCINTFAFNEENDEITMPILSSGRQKVPIEKIFPALLDSAIFWLEKGLPLTSIRFVLYRESHIQPANEIFARAKEQYQLKKDVTDGKLPGKIAWEICESKIAGISKDETLEIMTEELKELAAKDIQLPPHIIPAPQLPPQYRSMPGDEATVKDHYDYFVSYAHTNTTLVHEFVSGMLKKNQQLNIFYDRNSIPPGGLWIKQISDALQKSKKVLVFISPDYTSSMVCWDEFQCAKLLEYNNKAQMIQTIYLYNVDALPPIMGIYSWLDCREGDAQKLGELYTKL